MSAPGLTRVNRPGDNLRAAALMTLAMAGYTFNDACMKALSGDLPLGQAMLLRGILVSVLSLAILRGQGQLLRLPRGRDLRAVTWRTLGEVGAAFFFVSAIFAMPLGTATAILQALPLTVALGGALVFGERLGWRRLSAIVVGFAGVLLIIRPGTAGFDANALYAVAAVAAITLRDLVTRKIAPAVPTMLVVVCAALGVTVLGGGLAIIDRAAWAPISVGVWGLLTASALFLLAAYGLSVQVMRVGDAGFSAPFRYTGLIWAMLLGLVLFGERPDLLTLVGAGLVAGAGVFTLLRERALARHGPVETGC